MQMLAILSGWIALLCWCVWQGLRSRGIKNFVTPVVFLVILTVLTSMVLGIYIGMKWG